MTKPRQLAAALLAAAMLLCAAVAADSALISVRGDLDAGLTVSVQNAVFNVIALSLRYDTAQLAPAGGFDDTVKRSAAAPWLTLIDKQLDEAQGLLHITAFVAPGYGGEAGFDDDGHAVVGAEPLTLFTLHFTRIADTGGPLLSPATQDDGGAFFSANPNGAALLRAGAEQPFVLSIAPSGGVDARESQTAFVPEVQADTPTMTREERIRGTVLLPIGGSQAVVEGRLTPIYPGEPGVTAYAHSGRTFVPVRFVAECLGAEVTWVSETRTVLLEKDGRTVSMTVGAMEYTVDGEVRNLDVPAEFFRDPNAEYARTMVPIRFVAEALATHVLWDSDANFVILSPEDAPWNPEHRPEQELLQDAQLILSPFIQSLIPQE